MLNIKEAIAAKEEEEAEQEAEHSLKIVHKIANGKPKPERAPTRNPSFFQRMLSSKKMSRIMAEVGDGSDGSEDEEKQHDDNDDDESSGSGSDNHHDDKGKRAKNKHTSSGGNHEEEEEEVIEYVDPPLPFMGNPVNIDLLISRNEKAEFGLQKLMEMVIRDADEAIAEVKQLPVDKSGDRVTVTLPQSQRMSKIRTARDIEKHNKHNMQQIQKALNIRKSALVMMNSNYSKQLVRKIEPIYVNEARSLVQERGNDALVRVKPLAQQQKNTATVAGKTAVAENKGPHKKSK